MNSPEIDRLSPAGESLNILVIEDDSTQTFFLKQTLKNNKLFDADLYTTERLSDGIAMAKSYRFDAALLDLQLPDSDGLETFESLREAVPEMPVIVISGLYDQSTASEILRNGAQDYIHKSKLDEIVLARTIHHAIERNRFLRKIEQQKKEIEKSEYRTRCIIESSTDAMLIVDFEGKIQFVNPAAANMFGCATEELLLQTFGYPVSSESLIEIDILRSNREVGTAEMRVVKLDWHGSPAFLCSLRDITERKLSELRIREQATLLDKASDAIIVRNLSGEITFWSKGAERIYGWERRQALGRNLNDLVMLDEKQHATATSVLQRKGEWKGEQSHTTQDGREILVQSRWTMLINEREQPYAILAINSDVTEQKSLEAQTLRSQRMESIGTLASGIAHDLNNVLTPVTMTVDMLKDKVSEEGLKSLELIETNIQRGAFLIKQVLSFGRGMDGECVSINLMHIARELERIVKDTFPPTIEFSLSGPNQVWHIQGDPTQMHQILLNLCVNARDAMPDGGSIKIKIENQVVDETYDDKNLELAPGDYVCICVSDTGEGIPKDVQERIFDPFYTTKPVGKGTGLGLSTVLAITKSHKGFLSLHSEVRNGTQFRIYFPRHIPDEDEIKTETATPVRMRGNGETILLVDDEAMIRKAARNTLEHYGFVVLEAINGLDAIETYSKHKEDVALVLTDMSMPVMGGQETIAVLRSLDPQIPIIGSSGLGANSESELESVHIPDRFLDKPYFPKILVQTVCELIYGTKEK